MMDITPSEATDLMRYQVLEATGEWRSHDEIADHKRLQRKEAQGALEGPGSAQAIKDCYAVLTSFRDDESVVTPFEQGVEWAIKVLQEKCGAWL